MLNGPSTRCQHGFPASLTSNQFSDLLARNTWAVSTLPIGWWWVWVCTPFIYRGFPGIPPYSLVKSSIPSPKRIITRPQVYVHWATYLVSPSIPSWFEDMAIISGTLWYNIYQRYTIRYHRYLQSYILVHWYPRIPRYTKGFPVVHWSSKYQWATLRMPLGTQFQRERPWDHRHSFCWWQKLRRSRWNVVEEVIPKTLEQEIRKCPLKNSEDPLFYLWATIVVYSVLKYQTSLSRFSNLQLFEVILWHWWSTLTDLSTGYCRTWNLRCSQISAPKNVLVIGIGRSRNAKQKRVELPQNWRIWFQALHSGPFAWK